MLLVAWVATLVLASIAGAVANVQRTVTEPVIFASAGLCLLLLGLWSRPKGAVSLGPPAPLRPVPIPLSRKARG